MKIITRIFIVVTIVFVGLATDAQTIKKPRNGEITKVTKFRPPVVKSFLGRNQDTSTVMLEEAIQLASLPIKVSDEKNNLYTVTSFGFVYRRKGVVENEGSGKKEIKYTTVGDVFYKTPLPEVWKTNIARTLQKDEELYFYDILVKDKQNRAFFAPQILIKIK